MQSVDELLVEIRDQADEQNQRTRDDAAILRILNRGQKVAASILARRFPEPLLAPWEFQLEADRTDYTLPDDCYEDMLTYVQILVPPRAIQSIKRSYQRAAAYSVTAPTAAPKYWTIEGRTLRFLQRPTSSYKVQAIYVKRPGDLTFRQGLVTEVVGNALQCEPESIRAATPSMSTASDSRNSYVNIINGQTGEVRATLQLASVQTGRLTFRATPVRATFGPYQVLGSAEVPNIGVQADDQVCLAVGTSVPYFQDQIARYLVQYVVESLASSIQTNAQAALEQSIGREVESRLESAWTGRPSTMRVVNRSIQFPGNNWRFWAPTTS